MTPTTETRVPVKLDKERFMVFNANTMCAYEEATGKFFLDTVAYLHNVLKPLIESRAKLAAGESPEELSGMEIMRKVSTRDLRALLWASLHEYRGNPPEPFWPLTQFQVGRFLQPKDVIRIFTLFMFGQSSNSPTKSEMGESPAREMVPESAPRPTEESGGEPSIELPADAFV